MQDSDMFPDTADIIESLRDDTAVETERLERATVVNRVAERVDFVSEVTLEVIERTERATFPESEYGQLCRQRVPYSECYEYAPEDFSEEIIEFIEIGCQAQRCGDCDGDGTTVCSSCGGRGTKQCFECRGTGTQECPDCLGTGWEEGWDDDDEGGPCWTCSGNGEVACDAFGCDDGQQDCESCYREGTQQCSMCNGEGAVVTAVYGAIEFSKTRTIETAATAFETDLFELDESDGALVNRSCEEPADRIGKAGNDASRIWRRLTEQRSIPCVSVTYDCDGETYTAGWVDGEVRRGEYPPSEIAVREQIERAVDDNQFTYDNSPDDGTTGLLITDMVTTVKILLWMFGGVFILSAGINVINWLLGSALPVGSVGSTAADALSLITVLGTSLYITARFHERTMESIPGRRVAAMAGPTLVSVAAMSLLATEQVSLLVGGSIFGFAATLWGVSTARHLESIAEEAAFASNRRQMFLTETLDFPPQVVDRHDMRDLLPDPQTQTERRAKLAASIVGIGCVGLASLYTVVVLFLSLLGLEEIATMPVGPGVAIGVLALPTAVTLLSVGAVFIVRR